MADVEKVSGNPPEETKTGESRAYVDTEAEKGFGMFSRRLRCRANCVVRKVDCFVLPLLCLVCFQCPLGDRANQGRCTSSIAWTGYGRH